MKILKIDFENIHSLKGVHTIDFTKPPLSQTGIFAIVGPTGSGKSTLLDVIMLALYGEMPRFDKKITEKTVVNFGTVLTRGTNKAFAQVEYATKGKKYRSKWYIELKRKNYSYSMELADLSDDVIIEEKKSEVPVKNEEIIGLSYEQFLKSIILAQGNFAKFLKANPEERTQMLEKITGTQIYRTIGRRAFEVARDFKNKLSEKKSLLSHFQTLSNEERTKIEQTKTELEEKSNLNNQKISILNKKLNIKNEIKAVEEEIIKQQNLLDVTNKEIDDFSSEIKKLELHEKVYSYKTDIFEINSLKNKTVELANLLKNKNLEANNLEDQITETHSENKKLSNSFNLFEKEFEKNKVNIISAKETLKKVELITQEFEHYNSDLLKSKKELDNKNTDLDNKRKLLEKYRSILAETNKWLDENVVLENLKTDLVIIEQLFDQYNSAKNNAQHSVEKSSLKEDFSSLKLSQFPEIINKKINLLNTDLEKLSNSTKFNDIDELKLQFEQASFNLQILEKLFELSKNYQEATKKTEAVNNELKTISQEKLKQEDLLNKSNNEKEIVAKKIEELERRYEREQLEAKYETDRLKLENQAPCPLCGSTEHPYIKENKKVKIDFTKQNLIDQKKIKQELDKQIQQTSNEISSLKTKIETNGKQINEQTAILSQIIENFNNNLSKIAVETEINKTDKIQQLYKNTLTEKEKLQERIKSTELFIKYKNQLNEAIILKEKVDLVFEINSKTKAKLNIYEKYYQGKKNPKEIIKVLKSSAEKFDIFNSKLVENQNNINTTIALVSELESQSISLKSNLETISNKLNSIKLDLKENQNSYEEIIKKYFSGKSPDQYEKDANDELKKLQEKIYILQNKITELKTKKLNLKNLIVENNEKLSISKSELETKQISILEKLNLIGIKSIQEASNSLLADEKVNFIKQKNNDLQEKIISTNQTLKDNKSKLEKLSKNDDEQNIQQLEQDLQNANNLQTELNIDFGSLKNKLENDDNQRKKKDQISAEFDLLEAETLRWEKLSNLIGDAKGKRFAEIAQQFTLSELILLANRHLKKFSNRYILDKTGDTANNLFVYDSFMGMSKRSVHTLSGGETFLVSMSLALALSDLASRKTKIESLFIDEGFGTLDQATLDKALVNLERLHSDYNRTIGVISHVQEIKERINTQIKITKDSNGYSSISMI